MTIQLPNGWTVAEPCYGQKRFTSPAGNSHPLESALSAGLLVSVRKAKGHSQERAAAEIGVSALTVRHWEQGIGKLRELSRRAVLAYILGN